MSERLARVTYQYLCNVIRRDTLWTSHNDVHKHNTSEFRTLGNTYGTHYVKMVDETLRGRGAAYGSQIPVEGITLCLVAPCTVENTPTTAG